MGYNKRLQPIQHATFPQALMYINRFFFLFKWYGNPWKNYVLNDHVRLIIEATPNPLFFARSKMRSFQAFAEPEDIESMPWFKGFVGKYNKNIDGVEIIGVYEDNQEQEFRDLYKQHGGKANW